MAAVSAAPLAMTDATIIFVASAISGAIASIPAIITALRVGRVERRVEHVREIVDGPLSLALRSNADLAARVASLTGAHADALVASKAAVLSENRDAGKAEGPQKLA